MTDCIDHLARDLVRRLALTLVDHYDGIDSELLPEARAIAEAAKSTSAREQRCRGIPLGDGGYSGCSDGDGEPSIGKHDCPTCHGSGIEPADAAPPDAKERSAGCYYCHAAPGKCPTHGKAAPPKSQEPYRETCHPAPPAESVDSATLIADRDGDMHDPQDVADFLDAQGESAGSRTDDELFDAADVVRGLASRLAASEQARDEAVKRAEKAENRAGVAELEIAALKYPGDGERHRGTSVATQLVHAEIKREEAEDALLLERSKTTELRAEAHQLRTNLHLERDLRSALDARLVRLAALEDAARVVADCPRDMGVAMIALRSALDGKGGGRG